MRTTLPKTGGLSKKKKTILIVSIVLFVLSAGAGGYLLWRVSQPETIAPEDSEAGPFEGITGPLEGIRGGEQVPFECKGEIIVLPSADDGSGLLVENWGQFVCANNCGNSCPGEGKISTCCPESRSFTIDGKYEEGIYSISGVVGRGTKNMITIDSVDEDFILNINKLPNDKPLEVRREPDFEKGKYIEKVQEIGIFHLLEGSNEATMEHLNTCPPNGVNVVHLYKLCLEQVNICEKGKWREDPSGTHDYGVLKNPITVEITDSDGLGEIASATLNGKNLSLCGPRVRQMPCYNLDTETNTIEIFLITDAKEIPIGEYDLEISWKDGLGIGGSNCTLSSNIIIKEEGEDTSPPVKEDPVDARCGSNAKTYEATQQDWPTTTKEGFCAVGQPEPAEPVFPSEDSSVAWLCKEGSENVTCKAFRKETEKPPVGSSTDPSEGSTTAEENSETTSSKTTTTTSSGSATSPESTSSTEATTTGEFPETGIFDNVKASLSAGSILLFLGMLWSRIDKHTAITATLLGVNAGERRKKNFEKKIGQRI